MVGDKKKKTPKFYAVAVGKTTGIFRNWLTCNDSVNKVSGATFKGFQTLDDAEKFLLKSGVQCKWVDFEQTYVDSLLEDSESSKSRSRSPIGGAAHDDRLSVMSKSLTEQPPSTSDESSSHLNNKNMSKPVICSTSKLISDACSDTEERIKQNSSSKIGELEAIVKKQSLQIASLMEKQPHVDSVLQQFTSFQKRMSDLENSISNLIDQRFTELMSKIDISNLTSKLECLQHSIQDSIHDNIKSLRESIVPLSSQNCNDMDIVMPDNSAWKKRPDMTKPPQLPSNPQHHQNKPTRESNKSKQQPKHTTEFKPNQNVVIDIEKNSPTHTNFDADVIRREINRTYGPTIIQKISPYNFSKSNPRIMIQLHSADTAKQMVLNWKGSTFGKSTARLTMSPEKNENTAMLKGVPLDCDDEYVLCSIKNEYPECSAERLFKGDKKLRMIKVKFANPTQFNTAIKQCGFLIDEVICHFEPYRND